MPTADRFVTSSNLCEPTCADGRYRRELWRFSSSEGQFVLAESAACDAVAGDTERWRCDPADSPLATGEPIRSA